MTNPLSRAGCLLLGLRLSRRSKDEQYVIDILNWNPRRLGACGLAHVPVDTVSLVLSFLRLMRDYLFFVEYSVCGGGLRKEGKSTTGEGRNKPIIGSKVVR